MQSPRSKKVPAQKKTVTLLIKHVPIRVHNVMKRYRLNLIERDRKDYILNDAYTEFLVEHTKDLQL